MASDQNRRMSVPPGVGGPAPPLSPGLLAVALAGLVLVVFRPALEAGFELDDNLYVTDNPAVRAGLGWPGLRWAATAIVAGNWHPLTLLSHQLDVTLFGLDPRGHHLTSVLLHAATAAILFLLLQAATGATGRAFAATTLFALHPLRVDGSSGSPSARTSSAASSSCLPWAPTGGGPPGPAPVVWPCCSWPSPPRSPPNRWR